MGGKCPEQLWKLFLCGRLTLFPLCKVGYMVLEFMLKILLFRGLLWNSHGTFVLVFWTSFHDCLSLDLAHANFSFKLTQQMVVFRRSMGGESFLGRDSVWLRFSFDQLESSLMVFHGFVLETIVVWLTFFFYLWVIRLMGCVCCTENQQSFALLHFSAVCESN